MAGGLVDQPAAAPARYREKAGFGLIIGVTAGTLLGLLSPNLAPFQIGAFIDQLHFDEQRVGLLTTAELLLVSLVTLFSAPFFARISCARFALAGVAISLVGQLGTVLSDSYVGLISARCIAGLGLGMVYGAANAAGGAAPNPERFFSITTTAGLAFLAAFLPAAAYLSSSFGYSAMYGAVIALTLIAAPFLKNLGAGAQVDQPGPAEALPWRRLLRLLLALALFNIGTGAVWAYFERSGLQLGMKLDAIGALAGIAAVSGLAGSIAVAWVGGLWGRTLPLGVAVLTASVACYLIAAGATPVAYATGAILYWVSYMFMYPFLIGIAGALDPVGRGSAIAAGTLMTSYSLGPMVATMMVSFGSLHALAWLGVLSCMAAALALLPLTHAIDRDARSR